MSVYPVGAQVQRRATLSDDEVYRYTLTRAWASEGTVLRVVMLNPSTADATLDDPTIRRCVGFAVKLGHAALIVYNLYAFRATRPSDLWRGQDAVGPVNDSVLMSAAADAHANSAPMVAAWGVGAKDDRVRQVLAMTDGVQWVSLGPACLSGAPRHPLYLAADTQLQRWPAVGAKR